MIRVHGLTRTFAGRAVVRDVGFTVADGEVVGLLGPNGAGKTTTLRSLLGLLRRTAGTVDLDGPVGHLPEVFTGYDAMGAEAYLRFCADVRGVDREEVRPALAALGLTDLARRPVGRLSRGQRQRLGIAQAVLGRPPALVLDEPAAGLDPEQVVELRTLLRERADDGAAVLVSTHQLAEAAGACDRVVVLVDGCVVADEPPGDDLEARYLRLVAASRAS